MGQGPSNCDTNGKNWDKGDMSDTFATQEGCIAISAQIWNGHVLGGIAILTGRQGLEDFQRGLGVGSRKNYATAIWASATAQQCDVLENKQAAPTISRYLLTTVSAKSGC